MNATNQNSLDATIVEKVFHSKDIWDTIRPIAINSQDIKYIQIRIVYDFEVIQWLIRFYV